ncbi:HAMP domain-containing protein [Natronolimnobius sp. AArcel1]|uniref:methyl-accepting chemotaxis protein n=1 Tax=Natronolimnobius sp. AArcel1 TaxID=1679093 RepID=UPI0013E9E3DC|nr:methyl-accepting chemotaxis protein [Natronolimnobius sp. AArcel1]NGM70646.1 HAMP domain-containing protein [Natronolimnobius sp. AArcel1]
MKRLRSKLPASIRRSYALKFGIVLLLIGASVGMIGFVATEEIRAHVQGEADEEFTTLAQQEARSLQAWSESNEQRVETLVRSPDLRSLSTTELRQYTQHPARANAIHIIDTADAEIIASTDQGLDGQSATELSVPDASRLLDDIEPFSVYRTSPYQLDDEDGTPAVTYAQTTGDGAIGVVYTVELEQYGTQFGTYEDNRSTTMVIDGDGTLAFGDDGYGDEDEYFGESYGDGNEGLIDGQRATSQTVGSHAMPTLLSAYGFPDEEYVVGSAPVAGTDWTVLIHEPTADAYGFVTTVQRLGFAATAGLMVLVTALGAVIGRNTARSINRLREQAAEMEAGNLDVDLETDRVDEIGQLYLAFDTMRLSLRTQIDEARRARADAEAERRHTTQLNEDLTTAANQYAAVMQTAAEGDLTVRMDPDATDTEAMEDVAAEFNGMLEQLEKTIARLTYFAGEVAEASEQVSSSSETVRTASENVADSVQSISDGAARQNDSLQDVTSELSGLSQTTREIADASSEVTEIATQTAATSTDGRDAAKEAISGVEAIERESEDAVDEIGHLEGEVAEIDRLIEQIQVVADRTNMLALNTNLEAARTSSGSSDDFAAVAEQVKELSGNTKEAAEEVERCLERIREQTEESATAVERTSYEVNATARRVMKAAAALEDIAAYAAETKSGVEEISTATEQQLESTHEVVSEVSDIATISQETATGADTVAAATEEQTSALNEVTGSMAQLADRANKLSSALDRFETTDPDEETVQFEQP